MLHYPPGYQQTLSIKKIQGFSPTSDFESIMFYQNCIIFWYLIEGELESMNYFLTGILSE